MADLATEARQLLNNMDTALKNLLNGDCAENTKDSVVDAVNDEVYDAWSPNIYERRDSAGGMTDRNLMNVTVSGKNLNYTFKLEHIVPSNPAFTEDPLSDITNITESGGYGSKYHPVPGARPYMDKAETDYWGNGTADRDIENELKKSKA